jgi:uncharacterized protein YbjT (DUF2867 family)
VILVTGAAGKTGLAVLNALSARGEKTRALVHQDGHEKKVRDAGANEASIGNLESTEDLQMAMDGIDKVYLIVPNVHPREIEIGRNAIETAKKNHIDHFVYHSVLYPKIEEMPHHWRKYKVEERLMQSGLAFTILQPANYMQNILAYWDGIIKNGEFQIPYRLEARSSPVDLMDVAEVVAIVLASETHYEESYELCGPEVLSTLDTANIISDHLGKDIKANLQSMDNWKQKAIDGGLDADRLNTLIKMFEYYDEQDFVGNPAILAELLIHPPTPIKDFLQREGNK